MHEIVPYFPTVYDAYQVRHPYLTRVPVPLGGLKERKKKRKKRYKVNLTPERQNKNLTVVYHTSHILFSVVPHLLVPHISRARSYGQKRNETSFNIPNPRHFATKIPPHLCQVTVNTGIW